MTTPTGGTGNGDDDGWVRYQGGPAPPGPPNVPAEPPGDPATRQGVDWPRTVFTLLLALYGAVLIRHYGTYGFMDNVDLPIHEAGHIFFSPFGDFIQFLGGTLMQLIAPAVFLGYFLVQRNRYAATVLMWWIAQNLWNISVYMRDARSQLLPLVGGGEHDWAYLFGRLGVLSHDQQIAGVVRFAGIAIFLAAIVLGLRYAGWRLTAATSAEAGAAGSRS